MNNVYKLVCYSSYVKNKYIFHGYMSKLILSLPYHCTNKFYTNINVYKNMDTSNNSDCSSKALFQGVSDRFQGITVDSTIERCSVCNFSAKLTESLKLWENQNKKGIWFKVATENSDWIPILVQNGFDFHHAKPGYVMMTKWLPNSICRIPDYAHTMLAVGALIRNEKNEILAVLEKNLQWNYWKFPGGIIEPGEDIVVAAMREIKEETNIEFEFETLVAFMHAQKGILGCSDLYLIVAGKATTMDIKLCPLEIKAAKWFPIDEYLATENVTDFNRNLVRVYQHYLENNIKIDVEDGTHQLSKRMYKMYSAKCSKESS